MSMLWGKSTPTVPHVETRAEVLENRILAANARLKVLLSQTTDKRVQDQFLDLWLILNGGAP